MEVIRAEQVKAEIVEVADDGQDFYLYRRHSPTSWEILMGESWEPHYDCWEIENAYLNFKAKKRKERRCNK